MAVSDKVAAPPVSPTLTEPTNPAVDKRAKEVHRRIAVQVADPTLEARGRRGRFNRQEHHCQSPLSRADTVGAVMKAAVASGSPRSGPGAGAGVRADTVECVEAARRVAVGVIVRGDWRGPCAWMGPACGVRSTAGELRWGRRM
jgi:hypothetical protein